MLNIEHTYGEMAIHEKEFSSKNLQRTGGDPFCLDLWNGADGQHAPINCWTLQTWLVINKANGYIDVG